MKRILAALCTISLLLGATSDAGAAEYPKMTIRATTANPDGSLHVEAINKFKEIVEKESDGFVGNYGGNMDNKLITKGTRLYFPVRVPGALLQMGDVHATMGDAELCGTGIEIPAEITVRVQLVKSFELHWPVLETADKWYVNANAQEYNEALVNASKEMQRLLMAVSGWDAVETYMYLSVAGDVEINQGCKPCEVQLSLRLGIPKLAEFPALLPSPGQSR